MNSQHSKIKSWKTDLEEITADIESLLLNRYFYKELGSIVDANSELNKNNHFFSSIKESYIASAVLGVCRQIDTDSRSQSLLNLMNEIFENPELLTKKWFASKYTSKLIANMGEKDFESNFGKGEYIDPSFVYADIGELKHKTKKIILLRNQSIAHMDINFRKNNAVLDRKTRAQFKVTFEDLDSAIDCLEKKVIRYNLLLNQAGYPELLPVIQYDWQEIFTIPWIKKE